MAGTVASANRLVQPAVGSSPRSLSHLRSFAFICGSLTSPLQLWFPPLLSGFFGAYLRFLTISPYFLWYPCSFAATVSSPKFAAIFLPPSKTSALACR